jgi:hypothetical protein
MVWDITTLCTNDINRFSFRNIVFISEYTLIDEIQRPNDHNALFTASLAPTRVLTHSLTLPTKACIVSLQN